MVKGIGGLFLYSENPKSLADWYKNVFKLDYEYTEQYKAYYITFPYRELDADKKRYAVFSILYDKHRPFVDGKFFTLNLRVENMDSIVQNLKDSNIPVRGPEKHDEGVFAWVNDPEGNYIELWEDLT